MFKFSLPYAHDYSRDYMRELKKVYEDRYNYLLKIFKETFSFGEGGMGIYRKVEDNFKRINGCQPIFEFGRGCFYGAYGMYVGIGHITFGDGSYTYNRLSWHETNEEEIKNDDNDDYEYLYHNYDRDDLEQFLKLLGSKKEYKGAEYCFPTIVAKHTVYNNLGHTQKVATYSICFRFEKGNIYIAKKEENYDAITEETTTKIKNICRLSEQEFSNLIHDGSTSGVTV